MGHKNPMVELMTLRKEYAKLLVEVDYIKGFTIQQCLDMAQLALGDAFGFGPQRQERVKQAFKQEFMDYATMCIADSADDSEIWYTKEKVDRGLRTFCGDNVLPFDERYQMENLYLRGRGFREKAEQKNVK